MPPPGASSPAPAPAPKPSPSSRDRATSRNTTNSEGEEGMMSEGTATRDLEPEMAPEMGPAMAPMSDACAQADNVVGALQNMADTEALGLLAAAVRVSL